MKELQKFEGGGGSPPKRKMKLVKGTKFASILFIAASILISAGIMQAANVYYDLDTSTIMVNQAQTVSGGIINLNVSSNYAVNIGTGTTTGAVTIGGGSNTVAIDSSNWDVSSTGTMSNAIVNLRAGTATGGTAPLKFTAGVVNTTPEAGAMEFNSTGSVLTFTPVGTRYPVGLLSSGSETGKICTYNAATATIDCATDSASVGHSAATFGIIGATSNASGASIDGSQVITLQPADGTFGGVVSGTTQSFLGAKTFNTSLTSTGLLTASNGLTLTTGALNLTGTSGALALSGLTASSINTGAANLTFTSGNFNTTATGINTTAIGATTASSGAFTTLASSGNTTLGTGASSVNVIGSTTTPGTLTLHGATTLDNTLTVSGANLTSLGGNLSFTGTAPTISASTAATNIAIDAGTTGAVNIAGTSTGSINFAGGSGSTGCTITTAGVLTCTGNISGGGAGTRATGEAILVGLVPIFGYDYPAQTAATTFKNISRVIEDNPFPAATTGTTRAFKFIIRYADTLTVTQGPSLWNFYDVTTPASSIAFTVPYSPGVSLEEGTVAIVDATAGMKTLIEANGDWNLQVRPDDTATGKSIRVYSIDLAAYNVVD